MRPKISWSDLRGERVAVWGLGTEGRANLRKLRTLGVGPVLVDDRAEQIADEAVVPTDAGGLDAMLACSVVVKTPGIPRLRPEVTALEAAGVAVAGGLGLWLEEVDRERVLCITGTKGKSTTTAIAAHLARGLGASVFAGGNLGAPPYDPDAPSDVDWWVIETSSYQATDVASSPPVVAVTSLHPDHLPWHGGADAYYRDKLSLTTQPGARLTVASAASPLLVARRDQLGPQVRWIDADTFDPSWAAPLGLLGAHNLVNANVARACLDAMGVAGADDDAALRDAAGGFGGLDSRLELVGSVDGVDFVDDSLSTNVLPTLAAVDAFAGRRIALIVGGVDRDIDYAPLADGLNRREEPTLVLTAYATGPRIQDAIEAAPSAHVEARPAGDLLDAVRQAWAWAQPDGVVLLSPAAASFDAFDDYRHRARVFRESIERVTA
jgi:UDP-N-acetylmuramoylalanine--D-glutamate ligase